MKRNKEVVIGRASIDDVEEILDLQKTAYVSEAQANNDFTIPPLHQTLNEINDEFGRQIFFKAVYGRKIVGSVRIHLKKGTCYIGKLIVDPKQQNNGIGTRLLRVAELHFQDAYRYELFTGEMSNKNLYIYTKNGYRIFKNKLVSDGLTLVFLEKRSEQWQNRA